MGHKTRHEQKAAGKFRKRARVPASKRKLRPIAPKNDKYKSIRAFLENDDA